jgi:hypothetical protein
LCNVDTPILYFLAIDLMLTPLPDKTSSIIPCLAPLDNLIINQLLFSFFSLIRGDNYADTGGNQG